LFGDERAIQLKQELTRASLGLDDEKPTAQPVVHSELDFVPKSGHRIIGIDLARAFAIFGMVLVNYKNAMEAYAGASPLFTFFLERLDGRMSVTFVTLAGMGLVFLSQKAWDTRDRTLIRSSYARIVKRSLFILVLGILNYQIWPGDILHFYGFYLCLGALFLFTPSWAALAGAAGIIVLTFIAYPMIDATRGWENGHRWYTDFLTPNGWARNTFLNGYHPVLPWAAYCMVGVWFARRSIFDREERWPYLIVIVPVALFSEIVTEMPGFGGMLMRTDTGIAPLNDLLHLLVKRPYVLNMLSRQMVALATILISLELADRFQDSRVIGALAKTGRMALTHYLGHTLLVLGPMYLAGVMAPHTRLFSVAVGVGYFAFAVGFSVLWSRRFKQGPLEAVMRRICG
jgi:uncharacterized membrane protein YeiB